MSQFLDIHSMCGLVKLYFRILPKSLITTDVFERFIHAGKKLIYCNKNQSLYWWVFNSTYLYEYDLFSLWWWDEYIYIRMSSLSKLCNRKPVWLTGVIILLGFRIAIFLSRSIYCELLNSITCQFIELFT